MQDSNRDLERDKKLDRRWWQGLLLMLIVTLVLMSSATGFVLVFSRVIRNAEPTQTPWSMAGAILLFGLLLVMGIGGLVLLLFITRWSMEKQRRNFADGTRILQRTLPQLVSERETKAAKDLFSGKLFIKLLLLLPVYSITIGVLAGLSAAVFNAFGLTRLNGFLKSSYGYCSWEAY
ncbi:MAG: hypothetical protein GY832_04115 [Chloroflexi bacterium]|nr:hypothetical protein [Chloroflexota bacterium]